MTKKFYSPVNICNPSSLNHVVWLCPGQLLNLRLATGIYGDAEVDCGSVNLSCMSKEEVDGEKRFLFCQEKYIIDWSEYSSCLLGDIWIDSDRQSARLIVMASSKEKSKEKFITVVSPDQNDLRIRPHNIIEIVLFDYLCLEDPDWVWEWTSDSESPAKISLEQLGYRCVDLSEKDQFFFESPQDPYSVCQRSEKEGRSCVKQHHFWFRLESSIIDAIKEHKGETAFGSLRFWDVSSPFQESGSCPDFTMSISVRLDPKDYTNTLDTLFLLKRVEAACFGNKSNNVTQTPQVLKDYFKSNTIQINSGPRIREVSFTLIPEGQIEEGCNTIMATPSVAVKRQRSVRFVSDWRFGGVTSGYRGKVSDWWDD